MVTSNIGTLTPHQRRMKLPNTSVSWRKWLADKWAAIGGNPGDLRGEPTPIGEGFCMDTPGGGRLYQRTKGMKPVFFVHGSIGDHYKSLGGPLGYLGWPLADEEPFAEEGRWHRFSNGAIYWWPDTGAIDLKGVAVSFAGFHCFGETDWDGVPPKEDEVAFHLGVVPVGGDAVVLRTPVTPHVNGGGTYLAEPSEVLLYQSGNPYGMGLSVVLVEHSDIPDWLSGVIFEAMKKVSVAVAAYAGAGAAAIELALEKSKPEIRAAIDRALVSQIRVIGETQLVLGAKKLVTLAKAEPSRIGGVLDWSVESPLISGLGASYKMHLRVRPLP